MATANIHSCSSGLLSDAPPRPIPALRSDAFLLNGDVVAIEYGPADEAAPAPGDVIRVKEVGGSGVFRIVPATA